MTRTDSMVSGGPQTAGAAKLGSELHDDRAAARGRRAARRGLLVVPLALAFAIPAPALAQTTGATTNVTSGYSEKPPVTTKTEPKSGTAPSKESTTPKEKAPAPTTTTPATSTAPTTTSPTATESKLPFTGLDLRWVLGAGLLMLAAGLSIRLTQRRSARR
jgi:hypothetical protein